MNHIHLGSVDVGTSRDFYQRHFGFRLKFEHGEGVFLQNDDGFLIAIDPVAEVPQLPSWFHLGFCLSDPKEVKRVATSLEQAGCKFAKPYTEYGNDAVALYCFDPDGYKIEVSWHAD